MCVCVCVYVYKCECDDDELLLTRHRYKVITLLEGKRNNKIYDKIKTNTNKEK